MLSGMSTVELRYLISTGDFPVVDAEDRVVVRVKGDRPAMA
jgi:hypothetical protein